MFIQPVTRDCLIRHPQGKNLTDEKARQLAYFYGRYYYVNNKIRTTTGGYEQLVDNLL